MHAAEQDNWYLANEWSVNNSQGVFYHEDNVTGIGQIYVCNGSNTSSRISVYDMNGSLDRHITIASNRYYAYDLVLDQNGTIYIAEERAVTCLANDGTFKWRTGKNASISNYGSTGSGNGEFNHPKGITIGNDGNLFVADLYNKRVQVLDKNGSFLKKFGSSGTAPGQFYNYTYDVESLSDGTLVVRDYKGFHWFDLNGTFIKRLIPPSSEVQGGYLAVSKSDQILTYAYKTFSGSGVWDLLVYNSNAEQIVARLTNNQHHVTEGNWRYCFTHDGDIIISANNKVQIFKCAYRTKGLPTPNVIPQPAIRGISQRTGTNILDLDFEILDSDDTTATVGILAYAEGTRIVPQAWTDGTQSKIGNPIATNQVHRVSWDVKQDWSTNTGIIKFEILCQDARRTKPVDLHFLTLPLSDGNLTISRSPLTDSDYQNFFKYQVGIGSNEVAWNAVANEWTDGNSTTYMNSSNQVTVDGRTYLMSKLGYRYATSTELIKAREAATPGTTNKWTAIRPIEPRNLPNKVNEYGFDSAAYNRGWWVVKE